MFMFMFASCKQNMGGTIAQGLDKFAYILSIGFITSDTSFNAHENCIFLLKLSL